MHSDRSMKNIIYLLVFSASCFHIAMCWRTKPNPRGPTDKSAVSWSCFVDLIPLIHTFLETLQSSFDQHKMHARFAFRSQHNMLVEVAQCNTPTMGCRFIYERRCSSGYFIRKKINACRHFRNFSIEIKLNAQSSHSGREFPRHSGR